MGDMVDVFVIGGGINGSGIARDAAGRGLSVILCEKDDLAQGTSSRSGKLVHGGLRYLEYYEFRLVREALIEREVLLNAASHIIWPMRFVLPHSPSDRPAWLVRLGLFLYDHLGGRKKMLGTRILDLHTDSEGVPLKDEYHKGFEYSDCWVDDARLVTLNAVDAARLGAEVLTRTTCTSAKRNADYWDVTMEDTISGVTRHVKARTVVNAGGPWVNDIIHRVSATHSKRTVRLVKGSHIVVPKFWEGSQAYLVQNYDKRVIFINPYEKDKALIGTTDIPYDGTPEEVKVDDDEIVYLLAAVNRYFKQTLRVEDVVDSFSGVRPLYDDGAGNPSAVTRDYVLDVEAADGAPLLNIFGGKITTFRKLAEHALEKLTPYFPNIKPAWTASACLPGGDIENADFDQFLRVLVQQYPWVPEHLIKHYARLYGTLTHDLLDSATSMKNIGQCFAPDLYEIEVKYLCKHEWALTTEDILKRRTKHGLHMSKEQKEAFERWFESAAQLPSRI